MPAVINVGGPVAWGLVVLMSAWAVRAGRVLAGRRRARRKEQDDEALLHNPNACQPQHLQRLSATAIRMLIETGALPCAVLEVADAAAVADDGGRSRVKGGSIASRSAPATMAAASSQHTGSAAGAALFASRIVPPELAAAVPCAPVAVWVRALSGQEAWRSELARAAAAASGGGALPAAAAAGSSLRSPYASSYGSPGGRDGGAAGGGGAAPGRLPTQHHALNGQPLSGGGLDRLNGQQPGCSLGGLPLHADTGLHLQPQTQQQQAQQQALNSLESQQQQGDARSPQLPSADGPSGLGSSVCGRELPQRQQQPTATDPWVGLAASGCEPYGRGGIGRGGRVSGNAATISAAATANMAMLSYPPRHALLVVLGRSERSVAAVTAAAAAGGFSRVGVWVGPAESFAAASLGGPRLPAISRHALWLMLQLGPEPLFHVPSLVLDVRRPDERLLYGAIRGTVNIPADELAAALALPVLDFRRRYGVAQPGPWDVVVLHSRSGRRAAWGAQVCLDAGLQRVLVYGEGVYGWRLEDRVKPYRAYDLGALPPDPEAFSPEEPDEAAGFEELHELGLPMRQGPRSSRFAALQNPLTTAAGAAPAVAALGATVAISASAASAAAPDPVASAVGGGASMLSRAVWALPPPPAPIEGMCIASTAQSH